MASATTEKFSTRKAVTSLNSSFMSTTWSIDGTIVAKVFDRLLAGKVSSGLLGAAWMGIEITIDTTRSLKFCNSCNWWSCLAPFSL